MRRGGAHREVCSGLLAGAGSTSGRARRGERGVINPTALRGEEWVLAATWTLTSP